MATWLLRWGLNMEHAAKLSLVRQPLMADFKTSWSHYVFSLFLMIRPIVVISSMCRV